MIRGQEKAQRSVSIALNATKSGVICLGSAVPVALRFPAAFTGATVSFEGSHDGETFQQVYVGSSAYSITATASKDVVIDPANLQGFTWIKIVSASAEAAARSLTLFLRRTA